MSAWDLVADVGGTNTRLAVCRHGALDEIARYPTANPAGVVGAVTDFMASRTPPERALFAGAGPVTPQGIKLTNSNHLLERSALAGALGGAPVEICNDFEAAAWALATVGPAEVTALQGDPAPPEGPRLLIGPGTGLGVGALIPGPGGWRALSSEGGHIGVSPTTEGEIPIFTAAAKRWPETRMAGSPWRLEAEALLSGSGLPVLYAAVGEARELETGIISPEAILTKGRDGTDPIAAEAVQIFLKHLGIVAGDLAAAFKPTGGIFIAGGVAAANPWLFNAAFLDAFNSGGRMTALRSAIPLYRYLDDRIGLIGAANLLQARAAR